MTESPGAAPLWQRLQMAWWLIRGRSVMYRMRLEARGIITISPNQPGVPHWVSFNRIVRTDGTSPPEYSDIHGGPETVLRSMVPTRSAPSVE